MKRTQIQIHVEQWKWLKQHAIEEGISMAQLIRQSIDFYHEHIVKIRHRSQQKDKALKAVGCFSSRDSRANHEGGNLNSGA